MEGKNHILFISSWYPNKNNPTHGIFNKIFAEAASLYNKVSVLHVCSDKHVTGNFELEEFTEGHITTIVVYYKKVPGILPLFSQLEKKRRFLNAFDYGYQQLIGKTGKPDLIQLNVVLPAGIAVNFLSHKYQLPYVVNEGWTGYYPEDGNYRGIVMKYLTRKILTGAKVIMPVSERLKNEMLKHGLKGRYELVPNVVDTTLFVPGEARQQADTTFIHISALDDVQKNVSGIIHAFAVALKKNKAIKLVIVGDGMHRSLLQVLALQLKVAANITFTGRLTGAELVKKINQSDALVMFSNYETFCLTIAEALACGKPVITSRAGGLTDQIDTSFGITIDAKNEAMLSDVLANFDDHKNQFDPKGMREFITKQFTPEIIGRQLTEIYNSVLQTK